MEITDTDVADMQAAASSGDEVAKAALESLGRLKAPEIKPSDETVKEGVPAQEPPKEAPKEEPPKAEASKVDGQPESKREGEPKGPSKLDTIRELRKRRRELEGILQQKEQEWENKLNALEQKIASLQNGQKPASTETDDLLTRLLTDPNKVLSEREERLVKELKEIKEAVNKAPLLYQRQAEKSQAFKRIQSLEGFDKDDADAWDDLVDVIADKTGIEAEFLYEMADRSPVKFAALAERHWNEGRKLSNQVLADKKAAASGVSGGGKAGSTGSASLADLNAQFARSTDKKEQDEILKKMDALLYPK